MELGTCFGWDIGARSVAFTTSRDSNHREAIGASGVPGKKYEEEAILISWMDTLGYEMDEHRGKISSNLDNIKEWAVRGDWLNMVDWRHLFISSPSPQTPQNQQQNKASQMYVANGSQVGRDSNLFSPLSSVVRAGIAGKVRPVGLGLE